MSKKEFNHGLKPLAQGVRGALAVPDQDPHSDSALGQTVQSVKYKYPCGENQMHPAIMGVSSNLITFPWCSSAGRMYMASNMVPKSVVTEGRDERAIITGFEYQYADTARSVEAPANMTVEEIFYVKSLVDGKETDDWNNIWVIYKNDEKNAYDVLELPRYNTQNHYVGFEFVYDQDKLRKLFKVRKGATFAKGTVFARSPRISESGEWCFAMPTLVAAYSDQRCEEDGVVMTRSFAERSRCMFEHIRDWEWNEDEWIPLTLYGNKPFPECGDVIREDGLVMGFRRRIKENALVSLTKKALSEPDYIYDKLFYAPPGCEVMAVTVTSERMKNKSNNRSTDYIDQAHNQLLDRYEKRQNEMWNGVIRWYEGKIAANMGNDIPVTLELHSFIRNAYGNYTRNSFGKVNPLARVEGRAKKKDWDIEIKLKESVVGRVKFKYAGLFGDKGVCVRIIEDHEAPVYPDGTRAEFIKDNTPSFRRQIFGLLLELGINFVSMNLHREIQHLHRLGDYRTAFEKLMEYYQTGFPEFAELIAMGLPTEEERRNHVDHVARKRISLHVVSNTRLFGVNITNALRAKYPYKPQKAMIVNSLGEQVETINPILISVQDIILLDKFGTDMSAQSMPKSNLFGMPAKMNDANKYSAPMKDANNKNTGEAEGRWKTSQTGGQDTMKQYSLAYSPENRIMATKRSIRADDPFDIDQIIRPEEYANNRAVAMAGSQLSDSGWRLRHETPEDRRDKPAAAFEGIPGIDSSLLEELSAKASGEQRSNS